ncbi:MAG: adenylosuccinate synthetase [Gracilibacter sp. BRH_c7a]|nr:MAG: adenylosuccinate synthetase [Gracilibacter sp. BRH_c7a]
MAAVVLIGAQWGDEGKGKITDFLAERADMIVRYQGGNNAGHTVVIGQETYKLHLIPSGIFYPDKTCVIGNGLVIDPKVLLEELSYLHARGISTNNLRISSNAHVIMPYHRILDVLEEEFKGDHKIGTTKRGIGPAYKDKASRTGIRVSDLMDLEEFANRLQYNLEEKNLIITKIYNQDKLIYEDILKEYKSYAEQIRPYVTDTSLEVNSFLDQGQKVLFEGAQGTLLDVDHGTYPYVTSSNPIAGAACVGAGVGPTRISKVVGVIKSYTTRVGEGPFPTELTCSTGELIRERGGEYGTTTGRPRRCGWFDAVIARYAVRVSGISDFAFTKLDVLTGMDKLKICTGYRYKGENLAEFPQNLKILAECEAIYEEIPGWQEDITGINEYDKLPENAKNYVARIEKLTGIPVTLLAVGPGRNQTIVRNNIF